LVIKLRILSSLTLAGISLVNKSIGLELLCDNILKHHQKGRNNKMLRFFVGLLLASFLAGCTNPQAEATDPLISIELTEIVDKSTQRPITETTITLRWETSDGEVLDEQVYTNQFSLTTTLLADGDQRLWVKVEANGYIPWENAIRMKLNSSKPFSIKVEMESRKSTQGEL
jgi:hypothetical protein